jgi:hypothetical protein
MKNECGRRLRARWREHVEADHWALATTAFCVDMKCDGLSGIVTSQQAAIAEAIHFDGKLVATAYWGG